MFKFNDKKTNVDFNTRHMLAKTLRMFEYEGLPDTLPHRELEKQLQESGYSFLYEHEGSVYAFTGGLGGVPDAYGRPTEIAISNPHLKLTKTIPLSEGVLIVNDDYMLGLRSLIEKYSTFAVESDINMVLYGYATRMARMISASDDKTRESAQRFVDKVIEGEVAVVSENPVFDGVRTQDLPATSGSFNQLIEYANYIKATLYQEIGLSANNNMKRERLVTAEVDTNEEALFPLVYDMMACRLEGVEAANDKFSLSITVGFGSVWADKQRKRVDDIVDPEEATSNEHILENNSSDTGRRSDSGSESPRTKEKSPADGGTSGGDSEPEGTPGPDREGTPNGTPEQTVEMKIDTLEQDIKEAQEIIVDPDTDTQTREDMEALLATYQAALAELKV